MSNIDDFESYRKDSAFEDKAESAIKLLERLTIVIPRIAQSMRTTVNRGEDKGKFETRFDRTMELIDELRDWFDEGPDPTWHKEYFKLTGEHWVCIDEGWVPATMNSKDVTGEEPEEIIDEVNAPDGGAVQ